MTEVQAFSKKLMDLIGTPDNPENLFERLTATAFTVGGMVIHFQPEDRNMVLMQLTKALVRGLMDTSVAMGEPCDMEIVIGEKDRQ